MSRPKKSKAPKQAQNYSHPEADSPLRPDVGTQPNFPKKKRKQPQTYRYDSSLSPTLEWDENPAREQGEAHLASLEQRLAEISDHLEQLKSLKLMAGEQQEIESQLSELYQQVSEQLIGANSSLRSLKAMSQPFLNWAGKAERLSFEVPTLPLFVHERLSTKAIIETLKGHKKGGDQLSLFDLFADPQNSIVDQALKAYEHRDKWVNRMILGDSLQVMNSLLEYEGLGGQVQMIYMDPPYGVKFGSNFQPFVRKRDVKHNDDEDMTREPEMVQAYRDTWELGLHSYLTYLRDRLLLARELLTESGSVFVQISDENLHHVRELMDEVFGKDSIVSVVVIQKTAGATSKLLPSTGDFLLWYAKDIETVRFRRQFISKLDSETIQRYDQVELPDGIRRAMTAEEKNNPGILPDGSKRYRLSALVSTKPPGSFPVEFEGKVYKPRTGYWKTGEEGFEKLIQQNRVVVSQGGTLNYVRFANDFPCQEIGSIWTDISGSVQSRSDPKIYTVQTSVPVVQRCMLMTTDPGDLVVDPTCGSGTTAYVAEQWGRRWLTTDVSRVPLALARQRLLTATYAYYELKDEARGPAGGFVYQRKQNKKGEEVGGIVPHITLKSIANDETPDEEVLVDRPETVSGLTRVTGPFTVEAVIPTPVDAEQDDEAAAVTPMLDESLSFGDRMLEVLRKSPILRLAENKTLTLQNVRKPTKTINLSAECIVEDMPVALVFGPENGQVVERTVYEAAREARGKDYTHLYVIGFAIHPNARGLIEQCTEVTGIPATYIQATPDLLMGDLLKNMRSSQIFSVCGLPKIKVHSAEPLDGAPRYQVELLGLDVFNPATMENYHNSGNDVPAWFLDTDYNGLCFHVCQAFFPRTKAWDSIRKAIKGTYEESVWDHLSGTTSAPFEPGDHRQIAVKVIDDRGNELLVVQEVPG
jgi:adenine-specific DNA-methyltransferase